MADSVTEEIIFTLMYAIVMLVALVGNTLLIYIVWKKSEVRSLTSFMFVNMAVADLLVTLVMMPWSIAHRFMEGKWLITGTLGEITCRGVIFTAYLTVMASVLCLTFMAIDRFYAVFSPLNSRSIWFRKAKFVTPLVWVMSMALVSIMLMVYRVDNQFCGFNFVLLGDDKWAIPFVFAYIFFITYLLPLVVISILYAKVVYKIWFHEAPGNQMIGNHQQQRQIIKRRVIRMFVIIVVVFALCWFPAQAYHLFLAISTWEVNVPPLAMYLFYWLGHANSAINPWLYVGLSSKIRSAFTRMVSKKFRAGSLSSRKKLTRASPNEEMAELQV